MPITHRNAIAHACLSVLSQVIQYIFLTMPQNIPYLCFPNLYIQSVVLMQLFSLHGSGITHSLCDSAKISREDATGCPCTEYGVILWAQEDRVSREGGTLQTEKYCEETGLRAKTCSSSSKNGQGTGRQGGFAVLVAFLLKLVFFLHHQPLFFSLSLTVLLSPPPYFPLQCPFFFCLLFPVDSFWLRFTLPCQSSSWKQHSSCCFHSPLLGPMCHPLVPSRPPPGD